MNAVTFVDNPDTDLSAGENVIWNKLLGYALILTAEGYPRCTTRTTARILDVTDSSRVSTISSGFTRTWLSAPRSTRWGNDRQVYVFERQGYPGLLVGLNNDQWNSYTRKVQTNFGANVQLHDYTGHRVTCGRTSTAKSTSPCLATRTVPVMCATRASGTNKDSRSIGARPPKHFSVPRTLTPARPQMASRCGSAAFGVNKAVPSKLNSVPTPQGGRRRRKSSWKFSSADRGARKSDVPRESEGRGANEWKSRIRLACVAGDGTAGYRAGGAAYELAVTYVGTEGLQS